MAANCPHPETTREQGRSCRRAAERFFRAFFLFFTRLPGEGIGLALSPCAAALLDRSEPSGTRRLPFRGFAYHFRRREISRLGCFSAHRRTRRASRGTVLRDGSDRLYRLRNSRARIK